MAGENTVTEDSLKLNKRGLATFWELIQASFGPISDADIDEITGIEFVNAEELEH